MAAGALSGAVAPFERLAAAAAPARLPQIQYDVGRFIGDVVWLDGDGGPSSEAAGGLPYRFGPAHTAFLSVRLRRGVRPGRREQASLRAALDRIEDVYPFSPSGLFACVAYGLPYFRRLPRALVAEHMPRLLEDEERWALEEAVPAPTDITAQRAFPEKRFQVPVRITAFDLLLTVRSDHQEHLTDVIRWLRGSDRLRGRRVPSPGFARLVAHAEARFMVGQRGFPRRLATRLGLPYADLIPKRSPMWMGFADQQRDAHAPPQISTCAGDAEQRLTTARADDYFGRAAIQHASQVTLDLEGWYLREPYEERVGYMFRQVPAPAAARPDDPQRGPAFLDNAFLGAGNAEHNAAETRRTVGHGEMGHVAALQRSSRTPRGTPLHVRLDGPGYDALDLPRREGAQPKLQFSVFVPTAQFFRTMRRHGSSMDLARRHQIPLSSNGLEAFTTTTRRQSFLVPPRARRAFPLAEL
jgi:hypothetical protein